MCGCKREQSIHRRLKEFVCLGFVCFCLLFVVGLFCLFVYFAALFFFFFFFFGGVGGCFAFVSLLLFCLCVCFVGRKRGSHALCLVEGICFQIMNCFVLSCLLILQSVLSFFFFFFSFQNAGNHLTFRFCCCTCCWLQESRNIKLNIQSSSM